MVYAEGTNTHSLRPPEDGNTWVGVLNKIELITRSIYYFDFQIKAGDDGAAMRYLKSHNNLAFDRVYDEVWDGDDMGELFRTITPSDDASYFIMRGGHVVVTQDLDADDDGRCTTIFSTNNTLESGIHRVIVRYYCKCQNHGDIGSIGIIWRQGDDGSVSWAHESCITSRQGLRQDEHIFGMEYNTSQRTLLIYTKNQTTSMMGQDGNPRNIDNNVVGNLHFAATLATNGTKGNQLSLRACTDEEWAAFLSHKAEEKNVVPMLDVATAD